MNPQAVFLLCVAMLLPASTGCSLFGRDKAAHLESESERLLADYRYERERANRLELLNNVLTQRVESLEKRLAINTDQTAPTPVADRRQPVDFPSTAPAVDPWKPTLRR
ncbi:hypothetical protein CA51_50880 [Rosistilla oblonga]|uniref:Uncharacterized protein n=1 Tax=Rosistilla oblonga TaxID=2527990 RepID=A0A518IUB3_9BACT|nr:hypothetical protein [Rosistilla oblonga]QDV15176.1 hypothetical protein CA51_50880 [Rosistilla oblonga]QDV56673.1 hypothetical protein Mal33_26710 [Rosistilla oblonga]